MSINYFLFCMDCKEAIDLGKCVRGYARGENPNCFYFESIGGLSPSYRDAGRDPILDVDFVQFFQDFLIRHLSHELRVLPDTVVQYGSRYGQGIPNRLFDEEFDSEVIREVSSPLTHLDEGHLELIERLKKF